MRSPPAWLCTLALGLGTLVLLLLLPQRTPHGMDSDYFVVWLETGNLDYSRHPLYLHFAALVRQVTAPLGLLTYDSLLWASALAVAAGVMAAAAAARCWLGDASRGVLPALVCLATPAVFFFGTAVEIGGVLFGCGAIAWWLAGRWRAAPTPGRAVLAGCGTALAAGGHGFGHLLLPTVLAAGWLVDGGFARRRWGQLAAVVAAHAGATLLLGALLSQGGTATAADALGHLRDRTALPGLIDTLECVGREWLLAFAPWSVLALVALFVPRTRSLALVLHLGLLLHLPVTIALLAPWDTPEFGSYQLGLAVPAALVCSRLLGGVRIAVALLAGLGISLAVAAPRWPQPGDPAFAAGVAQLAAEGPPFVLVCGGNDELDGVRTRVEGLVCIELGRALSNFEVRGAPGAEGLAAWLDGWVRGLREQGRAVLLSDRARDLFATQELYGLSRVWRDHVPAHYDVEPVQRGGFAGVWLRWKEGR